MCRYWNLYEFETNCTLKANLLLISKFTAESKGSSSRSIACYFAYSFYFWCILNAPSSQLCSYFFAYELQYLAVSLADASTRRRKFQMKNKLPNTHIMAFKSLSDTTAHIQCNIQMLYDILGKIEIFHMVRMHWKLLNNIAYHYRAPDLIAAKYTATYK